MKKLTILLSGLCISFASLAQTINNTGMADEQRTWMAGTHGGFGPSWFQHYDDLGFEPSWNAGMSVIYAPWEHAGIGADLRVSAEGGRFYNSENYTTAPRLTYLRVPVKAIFFFRDYEKDLRPKISIGPSLGFLTGEKRSTDASALDIGGQASVGLNYRIASQVWLTADVNYYHGFVDVYPATSVNERNRHLNLDLGLTFGL